MRLSQLLAATLSIAGFTISATAQLDERDRGLGFEQALERYQEYLGRDPFQHHNRGRTVLANSRTPAALALLLQDYKKPVAYEEYARYTLAYLVAKNFNKKEFVPQLDALRRDHDDPGDMWMWVRFLELSINHTGDAEAVKLALESKLPMHRAAALLALGMSRTGRIKDAIVQNCVEFPRKNADRCVLLGAMSGALHERRREVNDPDYRAAIEAYISLLDESVGLEHVSKIQMARHLQWILGGPALFVQPQPWLDILGRGDVQKPKKTETSAAPTFFGISTQGERFCYVVDMSDTMCTPISPDAKPDNVPITGKRPKRKKGFIPTERDLPWALINTRWDLAREQLRISLLRLSDDKYFSVIWFGNEAGTLDSCKGMIRATKRNVDRVIRELDSIQPKEDAARKADGTAPYGVLRGKTNMHGGLRLAFGLSRKGFVEEAGYVDPKVLTEGCDTIFLLSDGEPSWDDFALKATNYDQEAGVKTTEYANNKRVTSHLVYPGPYVHQHWLAEDVQRMNAFRRIRMHCVGLGEANMRLMKSLAKMGNGETFSRGDKK